MKKLQMHIFIFAVSCRLSRKLEDSQEAQSKLVQLRTSQNKFLMNEMNKLRRYNRKVELKLREAVARVEAQVHRPADDSASGYGSSLADEFSAIDDDLDREKEKGTKVSPTPAGSVFITKSNAAVPTDEKRSHVIPSKRPQKGLTGIKKRSNVRIPSNKLIPLLAKEESLAGNYRMLEMRKESERANKAEAALDEALTDNKKLASVVHALTGFLKTEGYKIEGLIT